MNITIQATWVMSALVVSLVSGEGAGELTPASACISPGQLSFGAEGLSGFASAPGQRTEWNLASIEKAGIAGSYEWPRSGKRSSKIAPQYTAPGLPVVGGHLRVGTRLVHRSLLDSRRTIENSFLGSITELDLEQTLWPPALFMQWLFNEYVGLEAGWEHFRVRTVTEFNRHSDGVFDLSGPVLLLLGRYPNHSHFAPLAGVGLAFVDAEFENDPVWHNGFSYYRIEEYDAWVAAGSPPWPNNGYQRTIEASNARGLVLTAGCNFTILKRLSGEFLLRYTNMDVDAHYYLSRYGRIFDDRGITTFPMSCMSCSLGFVWAF